MKQKNNKQKKVNKKKKKTVNDEIPEKEDLITLDKLLEEKEKKMSSTIDEEDEDFVTVNSFKKSLGNSDIYTEDDDNFKHVKKSLPIRSSVALDDDEKYKGKVVKAKEILGDDKDKEEIDEDLVNILDEHLHKKLEEGEEEEEEEEEEENENEEEDDDIMNELDQIEEEDQGVVLMKKDDKENMKEKAMSVNNQLKIYDNILTVRIHLQKVVSELNKMTINDESFDQENEESIYSTLYSSLRNEIEINISLFQTATNTTKQPISIEEINEDPSEMSLDEMWDNLNNEWNEWKPYRDSTIESISNKVQESKGNISKQHQQYKTFNQSPINQINDILKDKERLLKRCQLYRLEHTNLKQEDNSNTKELSISNHTIRNENIYDDNDFYQQQLKELIMNRKSLDVNSTNNLLKLKMRHHTKKPNVDRKASKGRKLRFQVHPKIVNFCGPVPYPPCEIDKEQLFASLFGRIPDETNKNEEENEEK